MTVEDALEQCRVEGVRRGETMKDSELVSDELCRLSESLSPVEKNEARRVLISWLNIEDTERWHIAFKMVWRLQLVEAARALLHLADQFKRDTSPGAPMWAETVSDAAWRLSSPRLQGTDTVPPESL